jgi:hypothetical protein
MAAAGRDLAAKRFDVRRLALDVAKLYDELLATQKR